MTRSTRGPFAMNVNASSGLEEADGATDINGAGLIVAFLEENASYGGTLTTGNRQTQAHNEQYCRFEITAVRHEPLTANSAP